MEYVQAARSVSDVMISVHCHNDYGLAVANSLAGVVAGADQAHLTINGIGERSGNTSLEEFVMGCFNLYGLRTNINYSLLYETSRLVSRLTGVIIQPNKAIIGDNAFGHESGIHTHGILEQPLDLRAVRPLDGRKDEVAPGRQARGKARNRLPAAGDGPEAQGGQPQADRREGEGDGRPGAQHNRQRPLPDRGPDNGRRQGGGQRHRRARGARGGDGHKAPPERDGQAPGAGASCTRRPTSAQVQWTRRSTPSRRYSAPSTS